MFVSANVHYCTMFIFMSFAAECTLVSINKHSTYFFFFPFNNPSLVKALQKSCIHHKPLSKWECKLAQEFRKDPTQHLEAILTSIWKILFINKLICKIKWFKKFYITCRSEQKKQLLFQIIKIIIAIFWNRLCLSLPYLYDCLFLSHLCNFVVSLTIWVFLNINDWLSLLVNLFLCLCRYTIPYFPYFFQSTSIILFIYEHL